MTEPMELLPDTRIKPGMTGFGLVRAYIPEAADDDCDYILWNETAFPMADLKTVEQQIRDFAQHGPAEKRTFECLQEKCVHHLPGGGNDKPVCSRTDLESVLPTGGKVHYLNGIGFFKPCPGFAEKGKGAGT